MRTSFVRAAIAASVCLASAGCSLLVHPTIDGLFPPDGTTQTDGQTDGSINVDATDVVRPDVPPPDRIVVDVPQDNGCTMSCDDGIACTVDSCLPATNTCAHIPDNTQCTGGQTCSVTRGCTGGGHCTSNAECNDSNACTTDVCNPAIATNPNGCLNTPVDADSDGYPALSVGGTTCGGGTDCNDANAAVHPGAIEICNGIDDDCDGMIDNVTGGCPPTNDTCATATPMTFTGPGMMTIAGTTVGAMSGLDSSCGAAGAGAGDVWYAITYPANLAVEAFVLPTASTGDTVLVVRNSCTTTFDLLCDDDVQNNSTSAAGRASRVWIRAEPGATGTRTGYLIVDAYQRGAESTFNLSVRVFADPPPAMCGGAPPLDIGSGGAVLGRLPPRDSTRGSCTPTTGTNHNDDFYLFNPPAAGQAAARCSGIPAGGTPFFPSLYVRSDCTSGELACANATAGSPAQVNFNHGSTPNYIYVDNGPAAGTYQLTVLAP